MENYLKNHKSYIGENKQRFRYVDPDNNTKLINGNPEKAYIFNYEDLNIELHSEKTIGYNKDDVEEKDEEKNPQKLNPPHHDEDFPY